MPVELIEGFKEYAAGLPDSGLILSVWPDGHVTLHQTRTTSQGTRESVEIEYWETVEIAAGWFTDQGYGVQA